MAESKMVNDHRVWLKDAEKGKTRACILSIVLFLYFFVISIVNAINEEIEMQVFVVVIAILCAMIGSICLFNGYATGGRVFVVIASIILGAAVGIPLFSDEETSSSTAAFYIIIELCIPIAGLIFSFANFYIRRYFSFMPLYRSNKIFLGSSSSK